MKLPTLDDDYWTLRSAEETNRVHPDTFWLPPIEERCNLQAGQAAKLIVDIEGEDPDTGQVQIQGERMWVIVKERVGSAYIGILDNAPASIEPADDVYLCEGAEVPFAAEHVIDIGNPPPEYSEWRLSQVPPRTWPRE